MDQSPNSASVEMIIRKFGSRSLLKGEDFESKILRRDLFFDQVNDLICVAGFDGFLVDFNDEWTQVLGWSREELLALPYHSLIHPDDYAETMGHAYVINNQIRGFVNRYRCKDGSFRWLSWNGRIDTEQLLFFATARDVTEMQKDLEELRMHRQSVIAESKLAELGRMAGGIAHEINNPLTVITASLSILREELEEMPEPVRPSLLSLIERSERHADRITKIIRSLRAVARSGDQEPFKVFTMGDALTDALELCRLKFAHADIDLRVLMSEQDLNLKLNGRVFQITQVLVNLLNNAFDAVTGSEAAINDPQSTRWIEIEAEVHGQELLLHVTDSGPGIPMEMREKIMVPFFSTKGMGQGMGLGLSISRGLVEEHGGKLFVNHYYPHTRFVMMLPLYFES